MRISDWSSDVCSSEAAPRIGSEVAAENEGEAPVVHEIGPRRQQFWIARIGLQGLGDLVGQIHPLHADLQILGDVEEDRGVERSEEHTSELQSLMRISYAVFCLKKKK